MQKQSEVITVFKNMNKFVRAIMMFVIGCVVMLAVTWIVSLLKGTALEINWVYIIGMGVVIAVLDILIPPEQRKKNREKLMKTFRH